MFTNTLRKISRNGPRLRAHEISAGGTGPNISIAGSNMAQAVMRVPRRIMYAGVGVAAALFSTAIAAADGEIGDTILGTITGILTQIQTIAIPFLLLLGVIFLIWSAFSEDPRAPRKKAYYCAIVLIVLLCLGGVLDWVTNAFSGLNYTGLDFDDGGYTGGGGTGDLPTDNIDTV
jgi:hypothetical protein